MRYSAECQPPSVKHTKHYNYPATHTLIYYHLHSRHQRVSLIYRILASVPNVSLARRLFKSTPYIFNTPDVRVHALPQLLRGEICTPRTKLPVGHTSWQGPAYSTLYAGCSGNCRIQFYRYLSTRQLGVYSPASYSEA
jgi:hypothetical protein